MAVEANAHQGVLKYREIKIVVCIMPNLRENWTHMIGEKWFGLRSLVGNKGGWCNPFHSLGCICVTNIGVK